jgi:hypothetical protein
MNPVNRLTLALKALHELGPRKTGYYVLYQIGLRSGYYRLVTQSRKPEIVEPASGLHPDLRWFELPDQGLLKDCLREAGEKALIAEADEILCEKVRLFGGEPVPLDLTLSGQLRHWSEYERRQDALISGDVKLIWEAGRFGWAYTLGRGYHLSGDERYAAKFWELLERFLIANPPYVGPHWVSAQEAALRILAFAFALRVFASSPHSTFGRVSRLAGAIAFHAARIPSTLVYARSLDNNHLLSEAVGLYTAAVILPDHPSSHKWRAQGWRCFQDGLDSQIAPDGSYVQNSANYHRLMLQLALWVYQVASRLGEALPERSLDRLAEATRWLQVFADPDTGRVPNLGPNDGAYILPLTVCPFGDYRPVLQASGWAFLGERLYPPGPWDEMATWLGGDKVSLSSAVEASGRKRRSLDQSPHVLRCGQAWAYLRMAHFNARPGHADQLHLDLWWRGLNLAQDAGTYSYNALPPWDNALSRTAVHNTVTVNGLDQMTRAGRFLWLDRAQAWQVSYEGDGDAQRLVARHDGYRRWGVIHQRSVTCGELEWVVEDELLQPESESSQVGKSISARLHWLLPDWPYQLVDRSEGGCIFILDSPRGQVTIKVMAQVLKSAAPVRMDIQLTRAGMLVYSVGEASPTWGWASPTYAQKEPALSWGLIVEGRLPLKFTSQWAFPDQSDLIG